MNPFDLLALLILLRGSSVYDNIFASYLFANGKSWIFNAQKEVNANSTKVKTVKKNLCVGCKSVSLVLN